MTDDKITDLTHTVTMRSRNSLFITGITDIESFNEQEVSVYTCEGELIITGDNLRIGNINVDKGELALEGKIEALEYTDDVQQGNKIWEKLFR